MFHAEVPPEGWPTAFAIVTGCNPNGKDAGVAQNVQFDRRLSERLIAQRRWHWRVTGGSPDFEHSEPGYAMVLPFHAAIDMGREFKQEAIFWIEDDDLCVIS